MDENFKSIRIAKIIVYARAGKTNEDCAAEAIELAVKKRKDVELIHNDKSYMIRPNDLISCILGE